MFRSGEKRRSSSPDRGDTRKRQRTRDLVWPSHGETFEERRGYYLRFYSHQSSHQDAQQHQRDDPSHPEGTPLTPKEKRGFMKLMYKLRRGDENAWQEWAQLPQEKVKQFLNLFPQEKRQSILFLLHGRQDQVGSSRRDMDSSLSQEPDSVDETHTFSQEEREVFNHALDLLRYSPQEIEQRLSLQDQGGDQQATLAQDQHEVPSHQASTSNAEQVDEAKCQQIVEQLLNPPSKRKRMPRMNEKEVGKIMNILEEKKNGEIISDEKYNHCQRKIQKKVQNAKYHKDNKDAIKTKKAEYYEDNKDAIKTKKAEYYEDNKDAIKTKKAEYYENNRDAIKSRDADYRKNNKEAIKSRVADYRKNNKEAIKSRNVKYYENNKDAIKSRNVKYYENNKDAIKSRNVKYYENNRDAILTQKAEKSVQRYREALQKVNDAIVALEQEITSLQQQSSWPADDQQLLAERQNALRKWEKKKKHNEKFLERNLQKAQRLIQIQQELSQLMGENQTLAEEQASLPNAAEESSSPHATQEIRPLEERYHHWLAHAHTSHAAHLIGTAQDLYAEYHELQRHFEEELGPLLADF
jgi:hypothetical protein